MGRLYRCLRAVVRAVTPRMTTTWEEPFSGNPSVFVCNHVGAFGPIDMVVKFPLRDEVRVWCNEGIMNRKTCPAYVRQDYWWKPGCRLEPLYNATLPYIAAAVLPPHWNRWALAISSGTSPTSFPAVNSSVFPSRGHWQAVRLSFWPTSPPVHWTATPAVRY